jgi:hypothetical protein
MKQMWELELYKLRRVVYVACVALISVSLISFTIPEYGGAIRMFSFVVLMLFQGLLSAYPWVQRRFNRQAWFAFLELPDARDALLRMLTILGVSIGLCSFLAFQEMWTEDLTIYGALLLSVLYAASYTRSLIKWFLRMPKDDEKTSTPIFKDQVMPVPNSQPFGLRDDTKPEDELTEDDKEWQEIIEGEEE